MRCKACSIIMTIRSGVDSGQWPLLTLATRGQLTWQQGKGGTTLDQQAGRVQEQGGALFWL